MIKIKVKVKPNSSKHELIENSDGTYIAHLKSVPVDGKANKELIDLIAESFECKRSAIVLTSGIKSKFKIIEINKE